MKDGKKKRGAQGAGSIRKKIVTKNGKQYPFWEGRITIAGEQKSVSAKTQAECLQKMKDLQRQAEEGTYTPPSKLTVSQWLDIWLADYCTNVKPRTLEKYHTIVENQLKPAIGKIKLTKLSKMDVQKLCNNLKNKRTGEPLAPKTIKDIHGTLHKALQVAVKFDILKINVADKINIELPKVEQTEIKPLDDEEIAKFIEAIEGHRYKDLFMVDLFTGMREGEVCGLSWPQVNFKEGTITVSQQLQIEPKDREFIITSTKNGKSRIIRPAETVMKILQERERAQFRDRQSAGDNWKNDRNLVFTHKDGSCIHPHSVYDAFKVIAKHIGCPDARFHDLRHSFATIALANGDDIKTVSENLGHYAASFTLSVYGHSTDDMKKNSAKRMEKYLNSLGVA